MALSLADPLTGCVSQVHYQRCNISVGDSDSTFIGACPKDSGAGSTCDTKSQKVDRVALEGYFGGI